MAGPKIRGVTVEIGGDTTGLQKSLKEVNSAINSTARQLKDVERLLKMDPGNTDLIKQKQVLLAQEIDSVKKKIDEEKAALAQMNEQNGTDAATEGQMALQRDIIASEQKLKDLEKQARESASVIGEQFKVAGEKISAAGDDISAVGNKLMPVSAAIAGVGAASVKVASDFETAIAKLSTIADTSEATGVPLEQLEEQIKDLSDETGIAATDIAENVYNAISAGQKTGDAVNFVSEATKLATAGFADSGDALDLLTTILNAYGMEAENVTHVSDVLINTQNLGKTTVGELSAAMGKIIPTANASSVSLENLAAGYSIMTANGIATAETTTYMNSMLNELSKSGTKASDAIKDKTGKSFQDLMQDGASLADVLKILSDTAEENNVSMSDMFGSAEAGKAALTLVSGGVEEFNSTLQSMQQANGATDEAFAKLDTTARQAQISLNEVKNAGIELGGTILEMLAPYLDILAEKISQVTEWFKNLDEGQKEMLVTIAGIVAAVGPLLVIIGNVVSFIGGLITNIGIIAGFLAPIGALITGTIVPAIGGVIAAIAPFIPIIAAVIAAIVAVIAIIKNWGAISDWLSEKWEIAKEAVANIWASMKEKAAEIFNKVKEVIVTVFQFLFNGAPEWAQKLITGYINIIKGAIELVKRVFNDIKEKGVKQTFLDLIKDAKTWASDMINNFVQGIKDKIEAVKNSVKAVAETVASYLHFSLPDKGPLAKSDTWMPDMMDMLASTMENSINILDPALNATANRIAELSNINLTANNTDLINYLGQALPALGNQAIVLDSGALVGQTAGLMNEALGKLYTYDQRGV